MKDILLFLLLISFPYKIFALENLEIKENIPFYFVYMKFDGYHAHYDDFKPVFLRKHSSN